MLTRLGPINRELVRRRVVRAGVGRPHRDPFLEVGDLFCRELLALGRHFEIRIVVADGLDEEALVGLARDERRAGVAALQHRVARVELQAAFEFLRLRAVAGVAGPGEHGANLGLEKFQADGVGVGRTN
jgi:hypothetical protein